MNPVSEQVLSYTGGKIADVLLQQFKSKVIDRWSRYRAEQFFAAFAAAVTSGNKSEAKIDVDLNDLLNDDMKSEVLFESYRRVCLSKSKTLGPKCIGLLTAKIVGEKRQANSDEELWFDLFETGSNADLGASAAYFREAFENARKRHGDYRIERTEFHHWWSHDSYRLDEAADLAPLNLLESVGPWAARLEKCGLMWTTLHDSTVSSRRGDPSRKVTYRLIFKLNCEELGKLIDRGMRVG